MANTKKLPKPERKTARRKARRDHQKIYRGLTQAEKDAFDETWVLTDPEERPLHYLASTATRSSATSWKRASPSPPTSSATSKPA